MLWNNMEEGNFNQEQKLKNYCKMLILPDPNDLLDIWQFALW